MVDANYKTLLHYRSLPTLPVPRIRPAMADSGVRFSDKNDEIEPDPQDRQDVSPEVQKELRDLSITMQKSRLQSKRMENFAFEPVSLPASRVCFSDSFYARPSFADAFKQAPSPSPQVGSRAGSGRGTPAAASPSISAAQSPPLTPAQSGSKEGGLRKGHGSTPNLAKKYPEPSTITPQMSPPSNEKDKPLPPQSTVIADRPSVSARAISDAEGRKNLARSAPGSRTTSPSRKGVAQPSPRASPRPPPEEQNFYANNRHLPQGPGVEYVDPRYKSNSIGDVRRSSALRGATDGSQPPPAQPRHTSSIDAHKAANRRSGIFGNMYHLHPDENAEKERHGSMHDLKRFFKFGHKHKHSHAESKSKKSSLSAGSSGTGTQTPPSHSHRESNASVPFSDDHGLESKYGKFGKVLGSGAGGSVRLIKRASDGTTFAVKQFRARHTYESEKEYNKKVTAEYCVGSTLHHGNIIETLDIIQEKGNWFEVMEYAPYDLFACVMTGKMSREEVTCCFMQILSGVQYLHSMGMAHRDLKLDNVVVNDKGIMKLIDFGSAVVFRYPFEEGLVKASGEYWKEVSCRTDGLTSFRYCRIGPVSRPGGVR